MFNSCHFLLQWRRRSLPPVELEQFTEASIKVPTKHIIAMEDISINFQLGVGQFGVVQQGTWTTGNQRVRMKFCINIDL